MTELERLAALIAIEAPLKTRNRTTYVRVGLVEQIRAEITRRGDMDWKAAWKWNRQEEERKRQLRMAGIREAKEALARQIDAQRRAK